MPGSSTVKEHLPSGKDSAAMSGTFKERLPLLSGQSNDQKLSMICTFSKLRANVTEPYIKTRPTNYS